MSISSIASLLASSLAAVLGLVMLVQGGTSLTLQTDLQKRTQDIQTQQQEISLQQQQVQAAQQVVNTASQLTKEHGPQVINSLKIVGVRANDKKILDLLTKYGVQITDDEKAQIKKMIEDADKTKAGGGPAKTN